MHRIDFGIETVKQSSGVGDVFSNDFDKTWFRNLTQEEINKRIFTATPFELELGVDDGTVTYMYNSDFFRCDEFGPYNSKYHVVFGGCSETEGVGGNLEQSWSHKLYSKLKENYDIGGYYSLGKSGNGWHKIALSLIEYSNRYGKPTHFFVLLPNIGRNYYFNKDAQIWTYDQKYVDTGYKNSPHKKENSFDINEHRKQFIEFGVGWKIFQSYCKANSIKILYSTWDNAENNNLILYDDHLRNFFPIDKGVALEQFIEEKYPTLKLPKNALKKRDGHNGDVVHEYWKECFVKEIEKRGLFND